MTASFRLGPIIGRTVPDSPQLGMLTRLEIGELLPRVFWQGRGGMSGMIGELIEV